MRNESAIWGLVEAHGPDLIGLSDRVWALPETLYNEYRSCAEHTAMLRDKGFRVTENVAGIPTAVMGEAGAGGPVIAILGEYDALPGLSQVAGIDYPEELEPGGHGHGCGHNLLGSAALLAATALKDWLAETGTPGRVRYYGCPAEETCEGKVFMARAGAFDDLDAAITWHPGFNTSVWASSSNAVNNLKFRFRGRTAHAAGNPETGRSALDAVELMNVGVNYLREHMQDKSRVHYVITNGGGAPNVVPDDCEVWYFVRSPQRDQVEELTDRVRKIAEGAALMTETTVTENFISGAYNMLPNMVISRVMADVLDELGPMDFDESDYAWGQGVVDQYPIEARERSLINRHLPKELAAKGLYADVTPMRESEEGGAGSTDVSDVSWITPTAQFRTACFALGAPGHSWANTSTAGGPIGHKGMLHAAKGMAISASRLIDDPALLKAAQDEFAKSTDGRPYKCPIPAHVEPRRP